MHLSRWDGPPWTLDRSLRWRGNDIRWTRHGTGPPLVFCHGTPWSSALWEPIAGALAADFTVHLWDMVGYGRSTMADGQDVSLAAQSQLLADLVAAWEIDEPYVVAHDIGGAVALRAHLLHGVRYRALALVDVVALSPWGSEFFRLVGRNAEVFMALPARLHEALARAYIDGAAFHPLTAEHATMLVAPWLGPAGQAAFYRQMAQADQLFTDEVEPRYPSIDIPTLVVWGEQDSWIPVEQAHRLAAVIPGAELHVIPDAGHLVQLDAPAVLTGALQRWLLALPRL